MGREQAPRGGGRALRVLVTGGAGLVAGYLCATAPAGVELVTTHRNTPLPARPESPRSRESHRVELDRAGEVDALFARVCPDLVLHTAYSKDSHADVVDATRHVAGACASHGASLVHFSSDVVFSGDDAPYGEQDEVDPVHDYGRWKAEAERLATDFVGDACIVRTSLVVSLDPPDVGTRWLVEAVLAGKRPVLFDDEVRTPILALDLARTIWWLAALDRSERSGVWHLPGPEALTRLELGTRVLTARGLDGAAVERGSVHDHPDPRPADLTLISHRRRPGPAPSRVP